MLLHPTKNDDAMIEPAAGSPLRSHYSYDPQVEGLCHHSGRYLTRGEINEHMLGPLREQHDFPGIPELDRVFMRAAHARDHQHIVWSQAGIRGVALIIGGALLLIGSALLWRRFEQWAVLYEFVIAGLLLALGTAIGITAIAAGLYFIRSRTAIFHRSAAHTPQLSDFPLFCAYKLDLAEAAQVDLGNMYPRSPITKSQSGLLKIELQPEACMPKYYTDYMSIYANEPVGQYWHAGAITLTNGRYMNAPDLEYSHRLVLRGPTAPYMQIAPSAWVSPIHFEMPYHIQSTALYRGEAQGRRFVLELQPELGAFDSYTLVLRFRWLGSPNVRCGLAECRLNVPPALLPISRVDNGRVVREDGQTAVVWRNLLLHNGELALSVTFNQPLLLHQPQLSGSYKMLFDDTLSGVRIQPEHVWNVLGRHATERTQPSIQAQSTLYGNIAIDTARLSQEHEYVFSDSFPALGPPDHALLRCVVNRLTQDGVNILRIEQPAPRLDPHGTLRTQLLYWDIVGRHYGTSMFDAVDVHVVITGQQTAMSADSGSDSQIDLRVRCLHDPRNTELPESVDTMGKYLAEQLQRDLDQLLSREAAA